ncbi:MAG: DUF3616 domain-containing protein [Cyanobacteria bacterium J06632_22]
MTAAFLLSRALLKFHSNDDDLLRQLSAIARTPDGSLWVGSDEYLTLERLSPLGDGVYGAHRSFPLKDYLSFPGDDSEIDIEGLHYADDYLWVVGSHSLKRGNTKGKKPVKDIARLAKIKRDDNRYLLARLPVCNGEILPARTDDTAPDGGTRLLTAARLQSVERHNQLIEALMTDDHLGPFLQMGLPSKDNGFDIEGIAVSGSQIFLGLRGPVLRGWAIVLEIEVDNPNPGLLTLKELEAGRCYRKHFLNLNGQGIRELCLHRGDLIILAGPTMAISGRMQVFRLRSVLDHSQDTLWHQHADELELLFDLPLTLGADNAEGMTLVPCLEDEAALMVAYDAPHENRLADAAILVDIFRLPSV